MITVTPEVIKMNLNWQCTGSNNQSYSLKMTNSRILMRHFIAKNQFLLSKDSNCVGNMTDFYLQIIYHFLLIKCS